MPTPNPTPPFGNLAMIPPLFGVDCFGEAFGLFGPAVAIHFF